MGTLNGRRVAIYARYSSDKQSDASIEDQVHRARAFITTNGGSTDTAVVFSDYAVSGASMERPGMRALENAIGAGTIDSLVTESVDRISRDVEDAARFRKLLAQRSTDLVCLDGTRLTSGSKSDALMFGIQSIFAEQYRVALADKTLRGLEGNARNAKPTGGVAYGYAIETTPSSDPRRPHKKVILADDQAAVVRRIFAMYTAGHTLASIATTLNAEGVPAPRPHTRRAGQGWMHSAVRAMLLNEAYTGRWTYGTREWVRVPGANKRRPRARAGGALNVRESPELAIIDRETFDAVGARFKKRKTGRVRKENRRFVLSGLVRCVCGAKLTVNGSAERPYYRCSAAKQRGTCDRRRNIPVATVEQLTFDAIRARLLECADEVTEIVSQEIRAWAAGRPDRAADLRRDIEKRAKRIDQAVNALLDEPSPALRDRLRGLEAEQAAAVAELAGFAAEMPVLPSPATVRARVMALSDLRTGPVEVARERLRAVTGDITCDTEASGSFRLSGELSFAPLLAEVRTAAPDVGSGRRHSLVAGAGFEPTTFGL
jgi:site-specific DNA recombinase